MPEMDGYMLAEQLKQLPDAASTTVVMLTSGAQKGGYDRCRELGISRLLAEADQAVGIR